MYKVKGLVFHCALIYLFMCSMPVYGQQNAQPYDLSFAPDLWYNSVDGIRVGIRMRGKVPGTFGQGPHRLDAGLWLGTWFPDYPVSYYVSFTEPIPSLSSFNSEANIRLRTSIRTGYHRHAISFNKRWQPGFEEKNYLELSVSFRVEKRFENEYLLYPQIWQDDWLYIAGIDFNIHNGNPLGRYTIHSATSINIAGPHPSFINARLSLQQHIPLGDYFAFRGRLFLGASSNNTASEYLFSHSFKPYVNWMDNGTTRAKGTIPTPWMEQGIIQVAGGANLRGYLKQDIEQLNKGGAPLLTSIGALNIELDYPNPIDEALENVAIVGGVLNFRSYLFFDSGTSLGFTELEEDRLLADAGPGFLLSLNIPDYLGKPRGFVIRYEMPLWLSHPRGGVPHFDFRSIIGIGAVISL